MGRRSGSRSSSSNFGSGSGYAGNGIMNSGIYGHVGSGVVFKCEKDDDSMFCQVNRFSHMISQIISTLFLVIFILYMVIVAYTFVTSKNFNLKNFF